MFLKGKGKKEDCEELNTQTQNNKQNLQYTHNEYEMGRRAVVKKDIEACRRWKKLDNIWP